MTKKSEDQRAHRGNKTERAKTTDMEAAREHGNQVPMRNAHARHKLNIYSYTMRVKEVVKLTAPTCIGKRRKSKANINSPHVHWIMEKVQGKH